MNRQRLSRAAAIACLTVLAVATGSAQDRPREFDGQRIAGWSFTPGVSVSTVWDSNVALAGRQPAGGDTASDSLFVVAPFGQFSMLSTRTDFTAGYRGYFRRHVELEELDGFDQRIYGSLRHMATPRITWFLNNEYTETPTTDVLALNGVPFARVGTQSNRLGAGIEGRLSKYTDLKFRYENTWTSFDRQDGILSGGTIHSFGGDLRRRLTERATVGVEGRIRRSDIARIEPRVIWFQDVGGTFDYRIAEHVTFAVAGGLSRLQDSRFDQSRNAPYVRVGVDRSTPRLNAGITFERGYTPSFSFSGSNDTRELRGYVHMPFSRNRYYVQADGIWRTSKRFFESEIDLDTFVTNATVGYSALRWLRIEAYHAYSHQDSIITGGEVDRHRVGAQLVISQPMRIR